ncbi:MAG: Scr1 family TA system antitoxin-like transcriptional regulator, partial [Pseudonocardiaceae bacterium]
EAMRAQLRHLVAASELPSVCLQVLPASLGTHSGLDGSFTVLSFGDPEEPEIAYIEHTASALHLHKQAEVHMCNLVFDRLRSEALSPPDSAALIERLAAIL